MRVLFYYAQFLFHGEGGECDKEKAKTVIQKAVKLTEEKITNLEKELEEKLSANPKEEKENKGYLTDQIGKCQKFLVTAKRVKETICNQKDDESFNSGGNKLYFYNMVDDDHMSTGKQNVVEKDNEDEKESVKTHATKTRKEKRRPS